MLEVITRLNDLFMCFMRFCCQDCCLCDASAKQRLSKGALEGVLDGLCTLVQAEVCSLACLVFVCF